MTLNLPATGTFVGRIWLPHVQGPALVVRRGARLIDITSSDLPTMQALLEFEDPAAAVAEMREKLAAVGYEDARASIQADIDAWATARGLK